MNLGPGPGSALGALVHSCAQVHEWAEKIGIKTDRLMYGDDAATIDYPTEQLRVMASGRDELFSSLGMAAGVEKAIPPLETRRPPELSEIIKCQRKANPLGVIHSFHFLHHTKSMLPNPPSPPPPTPE